jgi:hypothetical protein
MQSTIVDLGRDEDRYRDAPKELIDICSDAMLVEEIENSSSFIQSKEVTIFFQHMFPYDYLSNLFI